MDPTTIQRLGVLRHQEILQAAEQDRAGSPVRIGLYHFGTTLIVVGQKLVSVSYPAPVITQVSSLNQ